MNAGIIICIGLGVGSRWGMYALWYSMCGVFALLELKVWVRADKSHVLWYGMDGWMGIAEVVFVMLCSAHGVQKYIVTISPSKP